MNISLPPTRLSERSQQALVFLAALGKIAALVLAIACLSWGSSILVPVALAGLLTFLLAPIVEQLQRVRLRKVIAVLIVVGLTGAAVGGVGWIAASQVTRLAKDLRQNPVYKENIRHKIDDLRGAQRGGFLDDLEATVNEITGRLSPPEGGAERTAVVIQAKDRSAFPMAEAALAPILEPIASAGLVAVLVIFMLLKYEDLRSRLVALFGEGQLTVTTRALADAGTRISRYLMMQFLVNVTYGLAVGTGLLVMGVPYSFLWGFLAAVLRYIPYVGAWIAAVFPIATSLAASSGWAAPLMVIGLYLVCELLANMVEPLLYGHSVGVSEVALLVASGFWAWLWGPVGLVLATPLTVCLVVLGRYVPALRPVTVLLGDTPALEPPAAYYQRLLAQDMKGAAEVVKIHGRTAGADSVYDDILIPALLLARQHSKQGILPSEDVTFILRATKDVLGVQPDHSISDGDRPLILACPASDEGEDLVAHMLKQLLLPQVVRVVSMQTLAADLLALVRRETPAVIFIAVLPGGLPQALYLCKNLRSAFPEQLIVVGYWGRKNQFDKVLVRLRRAGAGYLTTSLLQTRDRIAALVAAAPPDKDAKHKESKSSGA